MSPQGYSLRNVHNACNTWGETRGGYFIVPSLNVPNDNSAIDTAGFWVCQSLFFVLLRVRNNKGEEEERRREYVQLNLLTQSPDDWKGRIVEIVFWWMVFSCVSSLVFPLRSICLNIFRADSSRAPPSPAPPLASTVPASSQPLSLPLNR
jgi:hypothetical protein